jgi:hypothetical protein
MAMHWHLALREKMRNRQIKGIGENGAPLIEEYYENRGTDFEDSFEAILSFAEIKFTKFDIKSRNGAFDYLLHI